MSTGDGPFGPVVNGTQIVFFEYRPNQAAGYTFVALFALASLGHLICIFWHRAWFCIPFILGGISETFGYYGRALASDKPAKTGAFIMQNLLILAGAPFLAATIYMSLGRVIISLEATRHSILNVRWMTEIYVLIDIACIFSQFIGAAMPASGEPDAIRKGRIILIAGLVTQFVALSVFIITSGLVHVRLRREPPDLYLGNHSVSWQKYFWTIEAITVLMVVRSIVRTVEYLQGGGGFVISHEIFIYLFDAAPMFLVMLALFICHPGALSLDICKA
ncbi:RTA1-domain-containing protein [Annulohypoxylon stygium]|nr:RTA1-domain-containing protein [Annulohypoxylon stygium]